MDIIPSPLSRLTPRQHQALYEYARREALALRQQAISDAIDWIGHGMVALWHGARRRLSIAAHAHRGVTPCPR